MAASQPYTSFTITQAQPGSPLQFVPALGSQELEQLIDAYISGDAPAQDKMSAITLDFFNNAPVDISTGMRVRTYEVFPLMWANQPFELSPVESQSSGLSPPFYTPSPASSAALGDSGYNSIGMTPPNRTKTGRVSKKTAKKETKKVAETRLPGFSIMTKDGVDVTSTAGRGTKTKEQREHAHLMRIMKACEACKRKKIRCDPSHRRASNEMTRTTSNTTKSSSSSRQDPSPPASTPSFSHESSFESQSTIPAYGGNTIDDFVLFPEDDAFWNPADLSLGGDMDLNEFNFDINDMDLTNFQPTNNFDQPFDFFATQPSFQHYNSGQQGQEFFQDSLPVQSSSNQQSFLTDEDPGELLFSRPRGGSGRQGQAAGLESAELQFSRPRYSSDQQLHDSLSLSSQSESPTQSFDSDGYQSPDDTGTFALNDGHGQLFAANGTDQLQTSRAEYRNRSSSSRQPLSELLGSEQQLSPAFSRPSNLGDSSTYLEERSRLQLVPPFLESNAPRQSRTSLPVSESRSVVQQSQSELLSNSNGELMLWERESSRPENANATLSASRPTVVHSTSSFANTQNASTSAGLGELQDRLETHPLGSDNSRLSQLSSSTRIENSTSSVANDQVAGTSGTPDSSFVEVATNANGSLLASSLFPLAIMMIVSTSLGLGLFNAFQEYCLQWIGSDNTIWSLGKLALCCTLVVQFPSLILSDMASRWAQLTALNAIAISSTMLSWTDDQTGFQKDLSSLSCNQRHHHDPLCHRNHDHKSNSSRNSRQSTSTSSYLLGLMDHLTAVGLAA